MTTNPSEEALNEARFLLDRISELDWSLDRDDFARDWHGHVEPSLVRLDAALAGLAAVPDDVEMRNIARHLERLELAAKTLEALISDPTNNRARDVRAAAKALDALSLSTPATPTAVQDAGQLECDVPPNGISETLLPGEDRSPEAAAKRICAYLDCLNGKPKLAVGEWGPSLHYADMRIVANAVLGRDDVLALEKDRYESKARVALWNIFKSRGMADDAAYAAIKQTIDEIFWSDQSQPHPVPVEIGGG